MTYDGKKFYCARVKKVRNEEVWWQDEYVEKKEFRMTMQYRKFLEAKRKKELGEALMIMREKLEWQKKTYGEVDEIDLQEYLGKLQLWGNM